MGIWLADVGVSQIDMLAVNAVCHIDRHLICPVNLI